MRHPASAILAAPPLLVLMSALGAALAPASARADSTGAIYTCTTADGRRLTSDRPVSECMTREQRVLNADGSLLRVLPPSMSPEERAAKEVADRKLALERAVQMDAVRRDRNLMVRFPNQAAHDAARAAALDDVSKAMLISEHRVADLASERKPLIAESEFYAGKPLPPKLKQQLDANDASTEAQRVLIENQKVELARVNKFYDAELAHLKKLWNGAAPGSDRSPDSN